MNDILQTVKLRTAMTYSAHYLCHTMHEAAMQQHETIKPGSCDTGPQQLSLTSLTSLSRTAGPSACCSTLPADLGCHYERGGAAEVWLPIDAAVLTWDATVNSGQPCCASDDSLLSTLSMHDGLQGCNMQAGNRCRGP